MRTRIIKMKISKEQLLKSLPAGGEVRVLNHESSRESWLKAAKRLRVPIAIEPFSNKRGFTVRRT